MSDVTTIKVTKQLRDRLAARAQRDHVTLGTAIARALDESEERTFWKSVAAEHASLSAADRHGYLPDATLLDSRDPADDAVSTRNGW